MKDSISKTNFDLASLNARLDEVRMSDHERLRAKASLARTEAFADATVEVINLVRRLLNTAVVRPIRRWTTLAG